MTVAINLAHIEIRLSGGAANSDQNASLGGIISSTRVLSQSTTAPSNITGVTIDYAAGNPLGAGTLTFTKATNTFKWHATGETDGAGVVTSENGKFTLYSSGGGYVNITVTFASLPGSDQTDTITVANLANKMFDDISKAESYNGDTEYRCFYIKNTHSTDPAVGIKEWIASQFSGDDDMWLGLDPAGIGNGDTTGRATTVATEGDAPGGVTFSQPTGTGNALSIGQLNAGQSAAFWVKRVVPAGVTVSVSADTGRLAFQVAI